VLPLIIFAFIRCRRCGSKRLGDVEKKDDNSCLHPFLSLTHTLSGYLKLCELRGFAGVDGALDEFSILHVHFKVL
jgi:hypothetical protein